MIEKDYVIVGAEVDEAPNFLLPDGTISSVEGPGAVPLNVEFIGELMVQLSKRRKAGVSEAELKVLAEQVKAAMNVREIDPINGPRLTQAEIDEILQGTTVSIIFEERDTAEGQPDRNVRLLIVPSDKTLEITEAGFAEAGDPGFPPPLSYDLDRRLRLANLADVLLGIIQAFRPSDPTAWTQALQDELVAHVQKEIDDIVITKDADEQPADTVLNEIIKSPKRAFHRSVGIYATNMCR